MVRRRRTGNGSVSVRRCLAPRQVDEVQLGAADGGAGGAARDHVHREHAVRARRAGVHRRLRDHPATRARSARGALAPGGPGVGSAPHCRAKRLSLPRASQALLGLKLWRPKLRASRRPCAGRAQKLAITVATLLLSAQDGLHASPIGVAQEQEVEGLLLAGHRVQAQVAQVHGAAGVLHQQHPPGMRGSRDGAG